MDKVPITRDICIQYVIDQLCIGDPIVLAIFESTANGQWINFRRYAETADIIYQHAIKYDK